MQKAQPEVHTAQIMAKTALLALRARVVNIAKVPGRALRGLRVVFLGAGSENMWGLRREAGVNMRDKKGNRLGWGEDVIL